MLYIKRHVLLKSKCENGGDEEKGRKGGRPPTGGGGDGGEGCKCGRMRFEMEGVGRPPELEPGYDHGALIRYEMSVG